jgi:hypothetical protein
VTFTDAVAAEDATVLLDSKLAEEVSPEADAADIG